MPTQYPVHYVSSLLQKWNFHIVVHLLDLVEMKCERKKGAVGLPVPGFKSNTR